MTETHDAPDDVPAMTPAQPDTFDALLSLLHLLGNVQLYEGRLKELRKLERETARARIELVSEQAKHAEAVAKDRAELAALGEAARAREVAAVTAERKLEAAREEIREFNRSESRGRDARRYEPLPSGTGARDWGEGGRWRDDAPRPLDDPHYDAARPSTASDEMVTEKVPGPGNLHRSVPRPRKTLRRVQPDA
jgi:hypothetical protein